MLLRDVDLRAGTRNDSAHRKNQPATMKMKRVICPK